MKQKRIITIVVVFIGAMLFGFTKKENQKETKKAKVNNIKGELNQKQANLPFSFQGLDYFYFAVDNIISDKQSEKVYFSSERKVSGASFVSEGARSITCDIDNLLIRPNDSSVFHLLSENPIKIYSINYLYELDTLYNIQQLVFRMVDTDDNNDNILDRHDIESLYLSNGNGENLTKISPQKEDLLDWKAEQQFGLLYFRTREDSNKDGKFDTDDKVNLYEYDFIHTKIVKKII